MSRQKIIYTTAAEAMHALPHCLQHVVAEAAAPRAITTTAYAAVALEAALKMGVVPHARELSVDLAVQIILTEACIDTYRDQ